MRTFTQTLKFFFLACALVLASNAWAGQAHVYAYSSPQQGGYVYVANSNSAPSSYDKTKDEASQGGFGGTGNKTFYLFYKENPGYQFQNWYKTNESNYNNATTLTNTSSLTHQGESVVQSATGIGAQNSYYAAVFIPKKYDVTLNANTGVGSDQVVRATYDAAMPTTLKAGGAIDAPTKTGYSFTGYFDAKSNGTKYYNNNLTSAHIWNYASPKTLYAQWSAKSYTVNFNANGGSVTPASKTVTFDAAYGTLPAAPNVARTGYTFAGWWTSDTGGTEVTASTTVKITATQTLYAHWTANHYTITLNNQSATTAGTPSIAVTFDTNTNLTSAITKPTKTNCTFEGYFTETNGNGVQIIDNEGNVIASKSGYTDASKNWEYANNLTLYAYWKQNQTINWTLVDGAGVEYATGQEMGAVAISDYSSTPSGLDITYTTYPTSVATIVDGKLNVLIANAEVTVYANQGGDHNYNVASEKSKTFTTAGCTPDGYSVTAGDIKYGETLALSELDGVVTAGGVTVEGTLSWVEPATAPDAGENQPFAVLFTPTNSAVYSSYTFNVPVTVKKANPVITWNISSALRESTIYSHFIASSNTENNTLTVTETSEHISISGLDLITDDEIGDRETSTITLTAHQDGSKNYNEITVYKDIIIYPKVAQCLPVSVNSADILSDMGSRFDGSGGWCATSVNGEDSYLLGLFDVRYTQYVGIRLGNWNEGFSGIKSLWDFAEMVKNWNLYPSTKSIELAFMGVPDSLTISTAMQTVSYNVAGWHDAPNGNPTPTWTLYQKSLDGTYSSFTTFTGNITNHKVPLDSTTRYVKITLHSAFAGYVTKFEISQKKYIRANESELEFGTNAKPLQEPQKLKVYYSSVGNCVYPNDTIVVTTNNAAFYVDKDTITSNVGIDQMGKDSVYVRCNDINKSGHVKFRSLHSNVELIVPVHSTNPAITSTQTKIFQTGTEHAPTTSSAYRAQKTLLRADTLAACFESGNAKFDTLYIFGVSASAASTRTWEYSAAKGYKVPTIDVTTGNVHTPCFVYKKNGTQYTYVRTFDAATKTLNVVQDGKKLGFMGYKPASWKTTIPAIQVNGNGAELYLNNTEIAASGAAIVINSADSIYARGTNSCTSHTTSSVKLGESAKLTIKDSWKSGEASGILALRPATSYPSIDLGSANGCVVINGTQLELHNATNDLQKNTRMAIAHMSGTTILFDGEVQINDGSIGGADTLGMPKRTFIDGGTFNDGTVAAYTLKGKPKRPRNKFGEMLSRQTMTPEYLASEYSWYGHSHLTPDASAKVHPMLMDPEVWIFNGTNSDHSDDATSWNKGSVPGETADVLINAPMVVSAGELKVKSLTINWEDKGKGIPAVTVAPDGGLTVGEGGIDAIKLANPAENLVLRADQELSSATKGQTGFLRIHPASAEPMPKATVELYSTTWYNKANEAGNTTRFQCAGIPIADKGVVASTVFPTGTLLYAWNESSEKWTNSRTKELVPFKGYDLSQKLSNDGLLVTFTGTLASGDTTIDLAHTSSEKGFNLLANSYTAPISIEEFIDDDFVNASQTIYILNAGTKAESNAQAGGLDAAGKWVGIPAKTAPELAAEGYPCVIPSMQGFWVQSTGAGAQLKLNYDRLVMGVTYTEPTANKPLRVAKSRETEQVGKLMINLYTETDADCVFILESDSYDAAYEDGYDARKIASETMDVFTIRDSEQLGVDATNTIEGTRVGVRTGEETTYTFRFSHLQSDKDLVLWDKETKMKVFIDEDIEYTFYAVPNSELTERFQIVAANIPTITTGVDEIENGTKVQKFIKDNQLYILKDGVLYNATGAVVRK